MTGQADAQQVDQQRVDVTVNGVRLACYVSGPDDAPPLVLLHGLTGQANTWNVVGARFAEHFRVYAVDMRGHGESDRPGDYSFEGMAQDVSGLLDQLGLDQVDLLGHSMGGTVAYLIAEQQPSRIRKLVLEDTPPPSPIGRAVPERPAEQPTDFDWAVVPGIFRQLNDPDPVWWDRLGEITAPTLIVSGGATSHVPQDKVAEAAARIPDATIHEIPVGHRIHASRPEEFAEVVLGFLRA
jgi:pimeloyl-ACP methyl ester carboxylesterase